MYGFYLQTCDVDVEQEVSEIGQSAPFILITGASAEDENIQFFVGCEQALYLESSSVKDVIIDLICTYFCF